MGLYFRRSFRLGPLRLNASRGGLGFSTGIKGARVGFDSRSRAYVHCGRGGVYYRSFLNGSGGASPARGRQKPIAAGAAVGEQRTIESGDVSAMTPESAASLLAELRKRNRLFPVHKLFGVTMTGASIAAFAMAMQLVGIVLASATLAGTVALAVLMRRRRTFRVDYHLDDDYRKAYAVVLEAFYQLQLSEGVWLVQSMGDVLDRKYHAGANRTVNRSRVRPALSLPQYVKSNITPPMIPAGRQTLYLLPDRILVYDGEQVGAIEYAELTLTSTRTRFVERERPPADARQVDTTWMYVNRNGGPDKRFSDNRQLPIMEYAELRWQSASGLNELFQMSRTESAEYFAAAVNQLAKRVADPIREPRNR